MSQPKKCPKCGAEGEGNIMNVFDFAEMFGTNDRLEKEWFCPKCSYNFDDDEAEFWYDNCDFSKMKLSQIADVIMDDWSDNITSYAWPYVEAMMNLKDINDTYGNDNAAGVVSYFLANAKGWQGETAKKVKAYLKKLVEDYYKSQNSVK